MGHIEVVPRLKFWPEVPSAFSHQHLSRFMGWSGSAIFAASGDLHYCFLGGGLQHWAPRA